MTDNTIIRPYKDNDVPFLTDIWQEAFGDERQLIDEFFSLLPGMGSAIVAESGGKVVGMLYLLNASLDDKRIVYIYAVAVKKASRAHGIGRALCRSAVKEAYDIIATLPSEKSLYSWYENTLDTRPALFTKQEKVLPGDGKAFHKISAAEYGRMRAELLCGKAYIDFSDNYLKFQEAICLTYGGGMFAGEHGIACGYIDDSILYIKEALGDVSFIPSLCAHLGAIYVVIRTAASCGEPFIAAQSSFPDKCEWNLALD